MAKNNSTETPVSSTQIEHKSGEEAHFSDASLKRKVRSYYTKALVITAIFVTPVILLVIFGGITQKRIVEETINTELENIASAAINENQLWITSSESILNLLSKSDIVRTSDAKKCSELMADTIKQHTAYSNFGVVNLDGKVYCSGLPIAAPVDLSDRRYYLETVANKDFSVGEYQIGRITSKPSVNFGYPILDTNGKLRSVVFAALDLNWLNDFAAHIALPKGSLIILVDKNGTVLATNVEADKWAGKAIADQEFVKKALSAGGDSNFSAKSLDNTTMQFYSKPMLSQQDSPYVIVGLPRQNIISQFDNINNTTIIVIVLMTCIAMVVAYYVGNKIFLKPLKISSEQIEDIRKQTQQSYSSLIDNAPDPILTVDNKGVITSANKAGMALSGLNKDEIIGHSFLKMTKLVKASSLVTASKSFGEMIKGKKVDNGYEVTLITKGNKERRYDVSTSEIREQGRIKGFQVILRDITKRAEDEEKLQKRTEELERMNNIMTDRELKMVELKNENEELRKKLG